jgi:hypothetical protein
MKRTRDVLILLAVAAAFGVSLPLFGRVMGFNSPWFALLVMFCFLGLLGAARPLFVLRLPGWLRQVRAWETEGGLYRSLGVPAFGGLLRRTPLRQLQPLVYLSRCPGDPAKVQKQIEGAEAAHFWAAALVLPYMVFLWFQNRWSILAWFTVVQVVGNVYPILHLRWVRGRMKRVFDKKLLKHEAQKP